MIRGEPVRRRTGRLVVALSLAGVVVVALATAAAGGQAEEILVDQGIPYVVGAVPQQTVDVYRRAGSAVDRPALAMVHGGGFAGGSPDDLARQAQLAAQQGWVVFNLDYRTTSVLGTDGRVVVIGLLGGRSATVDLGRLLVKRLRIVGSTLRSRSEAAKGALCAELEREVWPRFADGALRPIVDAALPIEQAEEAHARLAGNATTGAVVLRVG